MTLREIWRRLMRYSKRSYVRQQVIGDVQQIIRLLDQGADIDAAAALDLSGPKTPLMWASHNGHTECVKVLLDRGAQVNMQNKDGWTALMRASGSGHMECVQVLLDRGADVNMQDEVSAA
ncbi:hypothetical protein EMCRGX_G000307 [Ephydatia muelleri]